MGFTGAFTALVTPFRDGKVDEDAYRQLIEWQIEQGINGLVPCGTTGEAATLSHAEQGEVVGICVDQVKGRVPVIAGAGSNNTKEAIELAKLAKKAGADAALIITPYYNKPTPKGLVAHFKALAKDASMPFIVYNVPGRTGLNLLPQHLAAIKEAVPEVVGVKEATADLKQCSDIVEYCGEDFTLLSGDDFTALPLLAIGGKGVISVVSNIMPAETAGLCSAYFAKERDKAKGYHYQLMPLARAMFFETNPIPVKTALSMMGKVNLEFRLPLVPLEPANEEKLKQALKLASLI